jgi:hypothetical protein
MNTIKKTKKKKNTHKYTYLIKQEYLDDKIPLTNISKIDEFKKEFIKRGNWIEYDQKNSNEPIDFVYMDGKYLVDKSLWKYKKNLDSIVDMVGDNHSISDKYNLLENLRKKTNINHKHLLNQTFINLYNIYKNPTQLNSFKSFFDKYKVLIFKPIHGIKGQDMETFDNFNKFKIFVNDLIDKRKYKFKHFNLQEYNKMNIEKKHHIYNIEWVLQEYIINPLLYKDRKFHMRGYFMYYRKNNTKVGYLLDNMTLFTAKDPYKTTDVGNKDIHDTHYKNTMIGINFRNDITDMIGPEKTKYVMDQILHIFKNVLKIINAKCFQEIKHCFQIFGCDIMITNDFTVKLIETNYMPGSPKIELLQHLMTNIVDPLFPPKNKTNTKNKTHLIIL